MIKMIYSKKRNVSGFTLVEMLVIIGIIGIMAGVLINSVSHVKNSAKRAKAQNAVNDAKVAMNLYLQEKRAWSTAMINSLEIDYLVAQELSDNKLLDLVVPDNPTTSTSLDRFGFLDEWGRDQLRKNSQIASETSIGADSIPIKDHRLQFRLDLNYDGFVDSNEDSPNGLKIRANVIIWSRGPDGKDDFDVAGKRYPVDDIISWDHAKVVADQ